MDKENRTEEINDMFWIYTRFNKGNNPEFDRLLEKWTSESEISKASGKEAINLKEYVNEWIANSNKNYTHDKFKSDIEDKIISVRFLFEPYAIIKGYGLLFFNMVVFLYKFSPYILFPIIAYFENNWWLLGGLLVCIFARKEAARETQNRSNYFNKFNTFIFVYVLFFIIIIVLWILFGFQHYIFWPFAILYGYNLFELAEKLQIHFALKALIDFPNLYSRTIEQNMIKIENKATDIEP